MGIHRSVLPSYDIILVLDRNHAQNFAAACDFRRYEAHVTPVRCLLARLWMYVFTHAITFHDM